MTNAPGASGGPFDRALEHRSPVVAGRTGAGNHDLGAIFADLSRSESDLRRFLHGLPGVDQVGAEARTAALATRSIKTSAKLWAIEMAIR